MKAQFNSINKSNQSFILSVIIFDKSALKLKFSKYLYNDNEIFKYHISIVDSKI
mgnify:CR=1